MSGEWRSRLGRSVGKVFTFICADEVVVGKLVGIDEECQEVVCELVSSSKPNKYASLEGTRIAISFAEIQAVGDSCGRGPLSRRRPMSRWHRSRPPGFLNQR